jgi:hypothetical protein
MPKAKKASQNKQMRYFISLSSGICMTFLSDSALCCRHDPLEKQIRDGEANGTLKLPKNKADASDEEMEVCL